MSQERAARAEAVRILSAGEAVTAASPLHDPLRGVASMRRVASCLGTGWLSVVLLASCESELNPPPENFNRWECTFTTCKDADDDGCEDGEILNENLVYHSCIEPGVTQSEAEIVCTDQCEKSYNPIPDPSNFVNCEIITATNTNQPCNGCESGYFTINPGFGPGGDVCYTPESTEQSQALVETTPFSSASFAVDGTTGPTLTPSGTIRYTIVPCNTDPCTILLPAFELTVPNFEFEDAPVNSVHIRNAYALSAGKVFSNGLVLFDPGAVRVGMSLVFDGTPLTLTLTNDLFPVMGFADPANDVFTFSGLFTKLYGEDNDIPVTVSFNLVTTHTNRAPVAVASPDGTIECNAPGGSNVELDAVGSSDPEDNIATYSWLVSGAVVGQGETHSQFFPLGATDYALWVFDTEFAEDRDTATITVEDTTAPTLVPPPDVFHESCDTGGAVFAVGMPTIEDVCDPSAGFTATVVDINGVPADIPLVSGFKFKQGETIIRYEATDADGNASTALQLVTVELGPSCCPTGLETIVGTASDDSINGGNKPQCLAGLAGSDTLSGDNQADVLFGGLGNDTCNGGNQSESIYGGVGNDIIAGDNGADGRPNGLWGGAGHDQISGGNGKDYLRGGAGADSLVGGNGQDVFVIAAACETGPGESIDGGAGVDRIESPLTESELAGLGVSISNVEEFVVTPTLEDAECIDP